MKWIGIYSGFFVAMLALALFITGVFQQGILPRVWGAWSSGESRSGRGSEPPPEHAQIKQDLTSVATPVPKATSDQAMAGPPALQPAAASLTAKPGKDSTADKSAQVKRLARMYEGMRPREAASVLEKLERSLAVRVLSEVRDRQAAKILGAMSPATAAELTQLLDRTLEGETR